LNVPQALSSWEECSNAWQKALECLSKPNLTPAELALKNQVEEGLKLANEGIIKNADTAKLAPARRLADLNLATSPWVRAQALEEEKIQEIDPDKIIGTVGEPILPSCVSVLILRV
jgi:hypothetical protein